MHASDVATAGIIDPDVATAARALCDWGFLAAPDLPDRPGPAFLLVALRDRPTLRHFDPELVEFWVTVDGRGVRRLLDRTTRMPIERDVSWGLIRIFDRLGVSNEYVSFGGHLSADVVDGTTIAVFTSPVPLLRRGGHSQPWDAGADSVAAFFARLLLAVDIGAGFEERVADADPLTRYAACIDDLVGRYRASAVLRDRDPAWWGVLRREAERLRCDAPAAWAAGIELGAAIRRPTAGQASSPMDSSTASENGGHAASAHGP